jgi:tripartite tricarboxylate transporter family receptor
VRFTRRSTAQLLLAPALLAALPTLLRAAAAEPYPAKPVRVIIPYPAGGPYDGIPRLIAQWITAQHGWSIVMDNRAGATGILGVMAAKQAPPDGHTLVVVTTSTHGSMPALKRSLSYDPVKDFAPIVLMADAALVLLVRDDVPVRNVAQLVELMREKPDRHFPLERTRQCSAARVRGARSDRGTRLRGSWRDGERVFGLRQPRYQPVQAPRPGHGLRQRGLSG